MVYSSNLSPHLTGNKSPKNWSLFVIVTSVFQVCRVSLLSSHQVRISIKSRLSFTTTSSALFNNWFIRQRAFIEIWSTWEVWRALKMLRVARGVAKSNSSFLSALQTSQVLHISMNAPWCMNQLFYNIFNPMENFFHKGFVCWHHERAQ